MAWATVALRASGRLQTRHGLADRGIGVRRTSTSQPPPDVEGLSDRKQVGIVGLLVKVDGGGDLAAEASHGGRLGPGGADSEGLECLRWVEVYDSPDRLDEPGEVLMTEEGLWVEVCRSVPRGMDGDGGPEIHQALGRGRNT